MIRPLRDVLVLRPLATPGMIGSLHIPDTEMQRNKTGVWCEAVAVGPDCVTEVGQRVHICAYGSHPAGEQFVHNGQKFTLIRERDVNGVET